MNQESPLESLAESLEHVYRHWKERRKMEDAQENGSPPPSPNFTIAMSGEAGTQGAAIASEVGKRLKWPVFDHELLELVAEEMGLNATLLEDLDEKRVNWLLGAFDDLLAVPVVNENGYVRHLVKTILALGSYGGCVIVGRGAPFILSAGNTLRVRFVGPLKDRVTAMSQRLSISQDEAAYQVAKTDSDRIDFVQHHFLKDQTDPRNYDLVFNVSRFSQVECAELIVEALRRLQAHPKVEGPELSPG